MIFLILGSGGREVAIAKSLAKNSYKLICLSTYVNKQMKDLVDDYDLLDNLYNTFLLKNKILEKKPDIVIIGSEKFLELGIPDMMLKSKIKCVGPIKNLADVELSKTFARNLLNFHNLEKYNPKFEVIYNYSEETLGELFEKYSNDFVIKDDGLCSGKGVKLFSNHNYKNAFGYVKQILDDTNDIINDNKKCLIEEKLYGEEFVLMSFCDGKNIKHMPVVRDFKKIKLGSDINTGSMGCIIQSDHSLPYLNEEDIKESQELNKMVMDLLGKTNEEIGYQGILYGSFMKTEKGIKLIEYNARFGDPECLVVLEILKTDLGLIFQALVNGNLDTINIEYENKNVICKYLVPPGYPDFPNKNIIYNLAENDYNLFHAGLKFENEKYWLTGSRTLAICKKGESMEEVYQEIEKEIIDIKDYLFYREDIGKSLVSENTNELKIEQNDNLYSKSGVNIEEGNRVSKNK